MKKRVTWIVLLASLLAACGSADPKPGRTPQARLHSCPDPRPQACTMDYNPVCGVTGKETETFANGCTACSEGKVKGYYLGACPNPAAEAETGQSDGDEPEGAAETPED